MSEYKCNFDFEYMCKIERQFKETEEEIAYAMISPFCERIVEKKLNRKELEKILCKGMQPAISLEKVKMAREVIEAEAYAEHIDGADCDDILIVELRDVLDILDKLIEGGEE